MLHIRPHHLIDIIRNIGQGRTIEPHPYGHAQHILTRALTDKTVSDVLLVAGADDICAPCIHLVKGQCDDILPQFENVVLKQVYNDTLDQKIMNFLHIGDRSTMELYDFINLLESNLDEIVKISTHPKEDPASRKQGLINGIRLLKNN
jgi:hypothetical protein